MAKENNEIPPTSHEPLPAWAQRVLEHLHVPEQTLAPVGHAALQRHSLDRAARTHHAHGRRCRRDSTTIPQCRSRPGKTASRDVTDCALAVRNDDLRSRRPSRRQLDEIAATTTAGTDFGLDVLSSHFERGVAAARPTRNCIRRSIDADFAIVQQQTVGGAHRRDDVARSSRRSRARQSALSAGDPAQRFATPTERRSADAGRREAWYATAYRPDMTTIVVIGDTTPRGRAERSSKDTSARWKAAGPKPNVEPAAGAAERAGASARSGDGARAVVGAARRNARRSSAPIRLGRRCNWRTPC